MAEAPPHPREVFELVGHAPAEAISLPAAGKPQVRAAPGLAAVPVSREPGAAPAPGPQ